MKNSKRVLLLVLLVFIFFTKTLYSEETPDNIIRIRSIKFEGLKRTKDSTMFNILSPIGIVVGAVYTSSTTNDIAQKLYSEHIFRPDITFDVVKEGNYVDITVHVKDRWTIIPFPIIGFSQSSWLAGATVTEENLFGLNKKAAIAGAYGSAGWQASAQYRDKNFLMENLTMEITIVSGQYNALLLDVKNDITSREYENIHAGATAFFKYKILEELSLGGGIEYLYYGNIENKISTVGEINSLGPYAKMEYKKATYAYPFEEGIAVRLNGGYQFSLINDKNYYYIDGEINTSLILTEIQRIGGGIFAGYGDLPAQREFRQGGRMGGFTLPQGGVAVDYYTSITAFYEIAFLDLAIRHKDPLFLLALKVFYEAGLYGSDILDNIRWHHGPGVSAILYSPFFALAGLEFQVAYDVVSGNLYFSFALSRYL